SAENGYNGVFFGSIDARTYAFAIQVVAQDGTVQLLQNQVCALPCPTSSFVPDPAFLSTCTFGSQVDATGRFDRDIDSGEALACY
ncbi:MAG: hypothetical protein AAF597_07950, partial [Bacteroidota bacterium]